MIDTAEKARVRNVLVSARALYITLKDSDLSNADSFDRRIRDCEEAIRNLDLWKERPLVKIADKVITVVVGVLCLLGVSVVVSAIFG